MQIHDFYSMQSLQKKEGEHTPIDAIFRSIVFLEWIHGSPSQMSHTTIFLTTQENLTWAFEEVEM